MTDDPIAVLERELVSAAARRAAAPVHRWPGAARMVAIAATVLVPALAVVGALALTRSGDRQPQAQSQATKPRPQTPTATAPPVPNAVAPLVAELGVLRRPQTSADLAFPDLRTSWFNTPRSEGEIGTPVRSLIRLATVAPWHARVFLVPIAPPTARQIARLPVADRVNAPRQALLGIYTPADGIGVPQADEAVRAGRAIVVDGGGRQAGVVRPLRVVMVVPDGVVRVGFVIQPSATTSHVVTRTVRVRGNVAAFESRGAPPTNPRRVIWYGPGGRVIMRVTPQTG